ncbi:MAG TPA: hypothetical protein VGQ57_06765 [Polyangiaceae bacterium]|jgi:hypothetical protein|nr:hypothetical protein [Polyangiaceae bacterium]
MTTRIDPTGPSPVLSAGPTAARSTAQPTRPFQSVLSAGAGAVMGGAEAAVRRLPGGPLLAAAFRPMSAGVTAVPATGTPTPAQTPEGYPAATGTPSGQNSSDPSLEGMLDQNADKNLYYIALQEKISAENRLYTAYSNVLRVRHDTMKNAIGNFR